ncbi:MAG: GGDEF and EAL domain-containing protein [Planctomycetota bacterium]
MAPETLRVLFVGPDFPRSGGLVEVLSGSEDPPVELHWEERFDQALERVVEEPFDLALVAPEDAADLPACIADLLALRPLLPLIACTRAAHPQARAEALAAGAGDHLALDGASADVVLRSLRMTLASAGRDELQSRYDALVVGARDVLWHWDVRTDQVRFSPRWAELLGLDPAEVGRTAEEWFVLVHPNDLDGLRAAIAEHLSGQSDICEVEYRIRHADGSYRWVACRAVAQEREGGAVVLAGSHADVHDFKSGAGRMLTDLFRDPLTGLPSRALFLERLGRSMTRMRLDPREQYAVLVLDLDRFQTVNDGLGHEAGDRLLTEVTSRLSGCVREGDTLTRLGSDKFAVLLDGLRRPGQALRVAESVLGALAPPIVLEGEEIFPSAGVGVAIGVQAYEKAEDVMSDAYSAMHRAKQDGGASYQIFDPEMQARSVARLRLEADLRHAVDRGELCLHYQPIVEMESGRIAGFEALLRWLNPERGLVSPGDFVPVAEETGLITPIGSWVLDEACRTSRRWNERYANGTPISVSVNLSGRQFAEPDLASEIEAAIAKHELDPRALKLEITESVLMENSASNASQIKKLRDLGLELMIDDFGTGYSSLSSLHRFPIGTLKIDRTFVSRMEFEEENSEIVRTIMTLGKNLDMSVVAEGVETQAQLDQLRDLGCEMGQGFLFSNAVDAESAEAWLETVPRW